MELKTSLNVPTPYSKVPAADIIYPYLFLLEASFPVMSIVSAVSAGRREGVGVMGGGAGEGDKLGQSSERGDRVARLPINLFHHVQFDCTCTCGW